MADNKRLGATIIFNDMSMNSNAMIDASINIETNELNLRSISL